MQDLSQGICYTYEKGQGILVNSTTQIDNSFLKRIYTSTQAQTPLSYRNVFTSKELEEEVSKQHG
jgi:hypothetical protein